MGPATGKKGRAVGWTDATRIYVQIMPLMELNRGLKITGNSTGNVVLGDYTNKHYYLTVIICNAKMSCIMMSDMMASFKSLFYFISRNHHHYTHQTYHYFPLCRTAAFRAYYKLPRYNIPLRLPFFILIRAAQYDCGTSCCFSSKH